MARKADLPALTVLYLLSSILDSPARSPILPRAGPSLRAGPLVLATHFGAERGDLVLFRGGGGADGADHLRRAGGLGTAVVLAGGSVRRGAGGPFHGFGSLGLCG